MMGTNQMNSPFNESFLYDSDALLQMTSESAYRQGILYFRENRVIECYAQANTLYAVVEGQSRPDDPYQVELFHDESGALHALCECEHRSASVCQHAVAALLSFANQEQDSGLASAMETAIKDRTKRGQTEVKVEKGDKHPWFGCWKASSVNSDLRFRRTYDVHIRSLTEKINFCTCPDRANNQLGTCKHIEAVLHKLGKNRKLKPENVTPPLPFVYHDWENPGAIRLRRTPDLSAELASLLDHYFDAQGAFTRELPDDFFRLCDAVRGSSGLSIGEDAHQAVQQQVTRQSHQLKAERLRQRIALLEGRLPGLKAQLYAYQVEGVSFLAGNGRALLADDMGLGKTLQAIAAAQWLITESGVRKVLIVCPASLKHQWAREIEKFTGHGVQVIQGNAESRQQQYGYEQTFFVMNYELVLKDLSVINKKLAPDLLILDEAQRIKNWRTQIATTVKNINSRYAFVLTGTPLENRLEDLYSLMQVVDQHVLGPLWRYLNDYHITDDKGKVLGYRNLSDLRQRIRPVMLRRSRDIVSDQLPGRITTRLDITLTSRQQELHDGALSTAGRYAAIAATRPLTPTERNKMLAALQSARMACDAAGLVDKETEGSPKLNELKTLVQELCIDNGQKMVVFSQWRGMTIMVEKLLTQMKIGYVSLHGQIPTAKRGDLMDRFAEDDSIRVFISTDAGGSGLNLQNASVLVNLDIPWNPAVLEQRNARVHRLGQRKHVQIVLMVARESYEERVLNLVGNKQHLFDNVVDPLGAEDVVGVTKKSLTAIIQELNQSGGTLPADSPTEPLVPTDACIGPLTDNPPDEAQAAMRFELDSTTTPLQNETEEDRTVRLGIQALQSHFGARLQQMMARQGGLILILDQVTDSDEAYLDQLDLPMPLAAIDTRTRRQLQRMGEASPLQDAQIVAPKEPAAPEPRKWLRLAQEKLTAAFDLFSMPRIEKQSAPQGAIMELLSSAACSFLSDRSDANQPMTADQAAVWLFGEALPKGLISLAESNALARILSLRLAPELPESLVAQSIEEVKILIDSVPE